MTVSHAGPSISPVDRHAVRARVEAELGVFLDRQTAVLSAMAEELRQAVDTLRDFLAGGKRIRASFCYWGWRAAGGGDVPAIITASAALELLQASALIHDDYMDSSDTRRGRPAVHRRFADLHVARGWSGPPERTGAAAAILLGDLCLAWCDELFDGTDLPAERLRAAKPLYHLMRSEVMAGQYLDALAQARGLDDPDVDPVARARTVITYKSAKYTVERPLQVGAALAGAEAGFLASLGAYGLPLGEAFQLRDDVLGVFGDPAATGKPAGDDLREGKQTVLVALAVRRAGKKGAAKLRRRLGDPGLDEAGVAELAEIIRSSGALADVEERIMRLTARAFGALDATDMPEEAHRALHDLAIAATSRTG